MDDVHIYNIVEDFWRNAPVIPGDPSPPARAHMGFAVAGHSADVAFLFGGLGGACMAPRRGACARRGGCSQQAACVQTRSMPVLALTPRVALPCESCWQPMADAVRRHWQSACRRS